MTRDDSFVLDPMARALSQPPYAYALIGGPRGALNWRIQAAGGLTVGRAATRLGARAAVRALYTPPTS